MINKVGRQLDKAISAAREMGIENPGDLDRKLNEVKTGADKLADSSKQLADGVQLLVDQTRNIGGDLAVQR